MWNNTFPSIAVFDNSAFLNAEPRKCKQSAKHEKKDGRPITLQHPALFVVIDYLPKNTFW